MSENRKVRRWNSTIWTTVPDSSERKPRQAVKRISDKQKVRVRKLSAMKREWIAEQFRLYGFCKCQGECQREIHDERDARLILDGHHTEKRQDVPELMLYVCRSCHRRIHLGDGV